VIAWERAFQDAGRPMPRERIRKQIGKGADMLLPTLLPEAPKNQQDEIAATHGRIFKAEFLARVQPFPCAFELIERLHGAGIRVLLASSSDQMEVDHYVELLGVKQFLTATTCSDEVESSKPEGDIFAAALAKIAPTPANQTIAIGDTPYDVIAAGKCGIPTIALRSGGFTDEELGKAKPVAIYDGVSDLFVSFNQSALAA
jgi:HAD superfamily hydrolase (TIGR01509 family)